MFNFQPKLQNIGIRKVQNNFQVKLFSINPVWFTEAFKLLTYN